MQLDFYMHFPWLQLLILFTFRGQRQLFPRAHAFKAWDASAASGNLGAPFPKFNGRVRQANVALFEMEGLGQYRIRSLPQGCISNLI